MRTPLRLPLGRSRLPGPVFVSYRRSDTAAYAGRIYDALTKQYGAKNVFMDLEGIAPAEDFVEALDHSVKSSFAILVVIGRTWLRSPSGKNGAPARPDYVLREVAMALAAGIPVFPVLVDGAQMPEAESLPEPVRRLAQLNAIELSNPRWKYDLQKLADALESRAREQRSGGRAARTPPTLRTLKVAAPMALLVGLSVWAVPKLRSEWGDEVPGSLSVACRSRLFPLVYDDGGRVSINRTKFMDAYEEAFGKQTETTRSRVGTVLSMIMSDTSITDGRWAAYMLATIYHETDQTWLPTEEPGKGKGLKFGEPVTVTDSLGNEYTHVYYGRGYVDLTWDYNYRTLGKALNYPLLYDPSLALQPDVAYAIASHGMLTGAFTGRGLPDYINSETCDYVNARRIISGTHRAQQIAATAAQMEEILSQSVDLRRYVVRVDTLKMHMLPDSASPIRPGLLTRGMVVPVVNERGSWKKVQLERSGRTGWVPAASLERAPAR